ncbi:MAG TPA: 4Fe-4S binding protein [Candidatus Onthovicinus excrementipullorum]|nr:4Fe-4S binding protein [Candidatus Onthovicinus excrementipullorum]
MIHTFVFSPTGGTQKALTAVAGGFSGPAVQHDLCDRHADFSSIKIFQEDQCVFAVPSFGGRVPAPAAERIAAVQGNGAAAAVIAVYGNRDYDDTFAELQDLLERCGFRVKAGAAVIAEHSIVHSIASGRPDEADQAELKTFGVSIQQAMDASDPELHIRLPGNRPYKPFHGVPLRPKAGEKCVRCGLCAEKCPVGAIPMKDPSATEKERCISCMRCIAVCPVGARSVPAAMVTATKLKIGEACAGRKKNQLFLPEK